MNSVELKSTTYSPNEVGQTENLAIFLVMKIDTQSTVRSFAHAVLLYIQYLRQKPAPYAHALTSSRCKMRVMRDLPLPYCGKVGFCDTS
jgi:hypothetical protein